jgi:hypothetical protein
MLYPYLNPFLDYFNLADFSNRSFQAMAIRINEFQHYLQTQKIKPIKKVAYKHLVEFAGDPLLQDTCRIIQKPFHRNSSADSLFSFVTL